MTALMVNYPAGGLIKIQKTGVYREVSPHHLLETPNHLDISEGFRESTCQQQKLFRFHPAELL